MNTNKYMNSACFIHDFVKLRAESVWPSRIYIRTRAGIYALSVNDFVLQQACYLEYISKVRTYLYLAAALAVMNSLAKQKQSAVFMDIHTDSLNDMFYASAKNTDGIFTVNIMQGFQRPYESEMLTPLLDRNDCINYSINLMNNIKNRPKGNLPFSQRFYDYKDDFVITTSYQNNAITCEIDPSYRYIYLDSDNYKNCYLPLLKRIGFTDECSPRRWDFKKYF